MTCVDRKNPTSENAGWIRGTNLAGTYHAAYSCCTIQVSTSASASSISGGTARAACHGMSVVAFHCRRLARSTSSWTLSAHAMSRRVTVYGIPGPGAARAAPRKMMPSGSASSGSGASGRAARGRVPSGPSGGTAGAGCCDGRSAAPRRSRSEGRASPSGGEPAEVRSSRAGRVMRHPSIHRLDGVPEVHRLPHGVDHRGEVHRAVQDLVEERALGAALDVDCHVDRGVARGALTDAEEGGQIDGPLDVDLELVDRDFAESGLGCDADRDAPADRAEQRLARGHRLVGSAQPFGLVVPVRGDVTRIGLAVQAGDPADARAAREPGHLLRVARIGVHARRQIDDRGEVHPVDLHRSPCVSHGRLLTRPVTGLPPPPRTAPAYRKRSNDVWVGLRGLRRRPQRRNGPRCGSPPRRTDTPKAGIPQEILALYRL